MKFSEILRQAISRAKAAYQARLTEGPDDDSPMVASGGDASAIRLLTTAECQLREFLEAQSPSVVYMLTAIMYLGRGDFKAKDLSDEYTDMSERFGGSEWAARQMLGTMLLADYLEEGLKKLTKARVDIDKSLPP